MDTAAAQWDVRQSGAKELASGQAVASPSRSQWIVVLQGRLEVDSFGSVLELTSGDAIYLRHATVHRVRARVPSTVLTAELAVSGLLGAGLRQLPEPLLVRGFASRQSGVVALLERCPVTAESMNLDPAVRSAYGQLLGSAMMAEMARQDGRQTGNTGAEGEAGPADGSASPADGAVRAAALAVVSAPERDWNLCSLSRAGLVGRTVLVSRFRSALGTSPMKFVRRVRIERAAVMLRESEASVTRVAFAVGYGSTAAFVRAFRAELGTTPGRWRHRAAGTIRSEAKPMPASAAAPAPVASMAPSPT